MMGLVFNIAQDVVEATFGPDVWDAVIETAGVDGAYTMLAAYPDDEFESLVRAAGGVIGISQTDVLVMVGRRGFGALLERHADALAGRPDWRTLLAGLDGEIHRDARKVYPEGELPRLDLRPAPDGAVAVVYRSRRRWCDLAEGLVLGVGDWYDVSLETRHVSCRRHGDELCVLEVRER